MAAGKYPKFEIASTDRVCVIST